jgi:hypothetical protein
LWQKDLAITWDSQTHLIHLSGMNPSLRHIQALIRNQRNEGSGKAQETIFATRSALPLFHQPFYRSFHHAGTLWSKNFIIGCRIL